MVRVQSYVAIFETNWDIIFVLTEIVIFNLVENTKSYCNTNIWETMIVERFLWKSDIVRGEFHGRQLEQVLTRCWR